LLRQVQREPIPALFYEEGTVAVHEDVVRAIMAALYDQSRWISLAFALARAAVDGDSTSLLDLAYPPSDFDPEGEDAEFRNAGIAGVAIDCADSQAPDSLEAFEEISEKLAEEGQLIAPGIPFLRLDCAYWATPARRTPAPVSAAGSAPILVVGTTGDPATPYAWSASLADQLESGVLLTHDGHGHTASFSGVSDCIDEVVTLYLLDLTVPERDTRCD
jgi:hypothetical protein